ncbi:hypothetical protein GCM10027434_07200 [Hymenobacter luteus]
MVLPATGTSVLGWVCVWGRKREPMPATGMTAFMRKENRGSTDAQNTESCRSTTYHNRTGLNSYFAAVKW